MLQFLLTIQTIIPLFWIQNKTQYILSVNSLACPQIFCYKMHVCKNYITYIYIYIYIYIFFFFNAVNWFYLELSTYMGIWSVHCNSVPSVVCFHLFYFIIFSFSCEKK